MEIIKPLRRSPHLKPLSRDHHNGLLLCWKIRQGLKKNIEDRRIVSYVKFCFEHELRQHFDQEERLVFSLVSADDPEVRKALEQHKELNWLIQKLDRNDNSVGALLTTFADLLDAHIRFEERRLFPYIEKNADPDSFDHAGKIIADVHDNQMEVVWNDEFWLIQTK